MWMFCGHGFFSVVVDWREPSKVVIRARQCKHLKNLKKKFSYLLRQVPIETDRRADYTYRLAVDKLVWAEIAFKIANEIDYTNFKDYAKTRAPYLGKAHVNALHEVWSVMAWPNLVPNHLGKEEKE